jgi:hypothetical protein
MPTAADFDQSRLVPLTGMTANPAAAAFPELVDILASIYADKVSRLPWVPSGWWATVQQYHGQEMNGVRQVLVPAFTMLDDGSPTRGPVAPWLDTPEKRKAWNDLATVARRSVMSYVDKQLVAGRLTLQQLYADADFWGFLGGLAERAQRALSTARDALTGAALGSMPLLLMVGAALFFLSRSRHGSIRRNPPRQARRSRRRRVVGR